LTAKTGQVLTLSIFDSRPLARGGTFHGAFGITANVQAKRTSEETRILVVFNETMCETDTYFGLLSWLIRQ
jgi:hypothetical protein